MPATLFDKLWDSHCIETDDDGDGLIYVDRVVLHERTGGVALDALARRGEPVRRPEHAFCVVDHVVDTLPGRGDGTRVPGGTDFIVALRQGAADFGLRLFDVGDEDQGISHLVSAEQGVALPGLSIACPDSHTCTLGALGALAFGIGTSELEHALATSTLRMARPETMRVTIDGRLEGDATAKDLALHLIGTHGASGGRGAAVEFSGEAVTALDVEGRMTLCNMAAEFGAATAVIAPDDAVFGVAEATPVGAGGATARLLEHVADGPGRTVRPRGFARCRPGGTPRHLGHVSRAMCARACPRPFPGRCRRAPGA